MRAACPCRALRLCDPSDLGEDSRTGPFGNWFEREGEGIVAQCFCHETEHLDGHLFTEKVEEYIDPEAMQGGDEE